MKIIFSDNSLKDLLNFRGDIITHFAQEGHKLILIAPNNAKKKITIKNCDIHHIDVQRSGMNPLKDLQYLIRLFFIYKNEKPDVIFHYTIKPNIYGSIASKLLGIPSVAMITGLGYAFNHKGIKTSIARLLYRISMRLPKKILLLNEENMSILIRQRIIKAEKAILLPGGEGINLNVFQ